MSDKPDPVISNDFVEIGRQPDVRVYLKVGGTRLLSFTPVGAVRLAYAILEAVNELPGDEFNAVMKAVEECE